MNAANKTKAADMALIGDILKYVSAADAPLCFKLGGREIRGIPDEFSPSVTYRLLTANTVQYIIEGTNADGLNLRAEYLEYRDYPVTEWVVYVTNKGECDTPIISDVRIGGEIKCPSPVLEHGNGDTCKEDGYSFCRDKVEGKITLTPTTGTSCQGALPYMTLQGADREIRIAIGWPTRWTAEILPTDGGVSFTCGQYRCNTVLHSGEVFRTPRINLMAYTNEGAPYRGINLWRSWYFAHILPRENGNPIPPKLCLHYFQAEGKPEFTGAGEKNQIHALKEYVRRGMKPDLWWIDAGWYPCDYEWHTTGTWEADKSRFPNGLAPLGEACDENGVQLMVWFEPERVRRGTELEREHGDWLLVSHNERGEENINLLLDLGNPEALRWLIERVDAIIKSSHIKIYRQDFNFNPAPVWEEHEAPDRIGMMENKHALGYLAYWDALILRNPGLWIDSCASGGRRNDLETMRRAVTLHYTDVGYGHHPIKQKQHREMFEWMPYFRAHNMSWDNEDGTYSKTQREVDEFAFHCALTPALTSMYTYDDTDEHYAIGLKMDEIWREAAEIELSGDYYPITECRADAHDWYAMQFDDPVRRRGFVQAIRNTLAEEESFILKLPCVHGGAVYTLVDKESGKTLTLSANELKDGLTVSLPKRSGVVYFYNY